jgi:transposase-like protein
MTDLQNPIFTDENKAREALEAVRWPHGPYCPHCGNLDPTTIAKVEGKKHSHRPGLYYCNACKGQFTVTVGTVFERSKIPLSKWMLAAHLLNSSKKGMSSHQMHRMLGVTYKTAWFMTHRIREAMKVLTPEPLGGDGKIVEADETYFGNKDVVKKRTKHGKPSHGSKRSIVALVERGGNARSFHVKRASAEEVWDILSRNVRRESTLHTDEGGAYAYINKRFAAHEKVTHSAGEYVRGIVHTNTIEGFFSIFKRGMRGIYQHCGEAHLHRYLAEFDFRYNNRKITDKERTVKALEGIEGKRLTYRIPHKAKVN